MRSLFSGWAKSVQHMTHSRGFFSRGLVLASPSLLALPRRAGARGCGGEGLRGFSGARSAPPCPRVSAALQRPPPRPAPGRAAGPSRRRGIPLGAGPGERTQASRGILASLAAAFPVFPPAAPAVGDLTAPQMGSPLPLEAQARTKPRPRVLMFYVAAAPLPSQARWDGRWRAGQGPCLDWGSGSPSKQPGLTVSQETLSL